MHEQYINWPQNIMLSTIIEKTDNQENHSELFTGNKEDCYSHHHASLEHVSC